MALVAGVDSSTQSTKIELRDVDTGALHASGSASHPPTTPPRSEQQPEAWWEALRSATRQVTDALDDVVALSVAAQQHGLVVLDDANQVIRPVKLWNDTESGPHAEALVERLGAAQWAARCGLVPVPSFTITKLAWLAAQEPAHLARVRRVMLPHDWLTWRLTGAHVTDRGDASGTGWWDPAAGDYRPDLLTLVDGSDDWVERLPRVLGPFEPAGTVTDEAAAELRLREETIVGPGTGDNMAAALGLGLASGDVVISLGTSGTVFARSETPTADPTGAVAGFADATGRFLPLVCTLNATKVTDTVARWLGVDHDALAELALGSTSGAGGVVLVPYFDGERTPNLPDATGSLSGLRTDTRREDLARAAHEGVVCSLLDGVDSLRAVGVETSGRLLLTGGGARSGAYRRVAADLYGAPVVIPDAEEVVAAGAAVQAASVLTGATPDEVAHRWGLGRGTTVEPAEGVDGSIVRTAYHRAAATLI